MIAAMARFCDPFMGKCRGAIIIGASLSLLGCGNPGQARHHVQTIPEIQGEILSLENQWAQVDVTNDRAVFDRILAMDFHNISSRDGRRIDRAEFLDEWEYEGVIAAANRDTDVQVLSADLAIYTGTDETTGRNADGSPWVHRDICTDTWLRRNGEWRCVAAHCSRIE